MVNQFSGFTIDHSGLGKYSTSTRESTLNLVRTHKNHIVGNTDKVNPMSDMKESDFGSVLMSQLDRVSALDNKAQTLTEQFLVDPDSINEHDVTIASTEATLALDITTNIIQRAIETYRSIISLQ